MVAKPIDYFFFGLGKGVFLGSFLEGPFLGAGDFLIGLTGMI
jgi:hypothetical protein